MKRSSSPSDPASGVADSSASNNGNHKRSKVSSICDYNGYSFQKQKPEIETVKSSELTALQFFDRFISQRKPCILHSAPSETMLDATWKMTPQTLVDVAGQEVVQVEKRFSSEESFGQNRTKSRQIQMTIKELVDKLNRPEGELLYLSTQQQQPENDTSDNEQKPPSAFQTPCAQLLKAKILQPTLPWASNLRLESCNLWMGSSLNGSSSGLHHDYHDNFYLLVRGSKEFRLYSPDTALAMDTYGTIERIHVNGVISYVGSETRADGTPIKGLDDNENESGNGDASDDDGQDDDSEEEIVLGKGFDYQSDDDSEHDDAAIDMDGPDDFDKLVEGSGDEDKVETPGTDKDKQNNDELLERPNCFSRIDPTNVDPKMHGDFLECKEYVVKLEAGQILYLPAGWFHCVTSFSSPRHTEKEADKDNANQVHLALNYWYHPPDQLDSFDSPYRDRKSHT